MSGNSRCFVMGAFLFKIHFLLLAALFFVGIQSNSLADTKPSSQCSELFNFAHYTEQNKNGIWQESLWELQKLKDPNASEMERFLADTLSSGDVVKRTPLNRGISGAMLIEFENGVKGIQKVQQQENGLNAYAEVAAYQLDKMLGHVNRVPLTVFRKVNNEWSSVQLFVPEAVHYGERPATLDRNIRLFDYLTDNTDRKNDNLLVLKNGATVAIDNGLGFRWHFARKSGVSDSVAWSLMLRDCCARILFPGISDSRAQVFFVELFKGHVPSSYFSLLKITDDQIRKQMKGILPTEEINNLISRKNYLIQQIEPIRK